MSTHSYTQLPGDESSENASSSEAALESTSRELNQIAHKLAQLSLVFVHYKIYEQPEPLQDFTNAYEKVLNNISNDTNTTNQNSERSGLRIAGQASVVRRLREMMMMRSVKDGDVKAVLADFNEMHKALAQACVRERFSQFAVSDDLQKRFIEQTGLNAELPRLNTRDPVSTNSIILPKLFNPREIESFVASNSSLQDAALMRQSPSQASSPSEMASSPSQASSPSEMASSPSQASSPSEMASSPSQASSPSEMASSPSQASSSPSTLSPTSAFEDLEDSQFKSRGNASKVANFLTHQLPILAGAAVAGGVAIAAAPFTAGVSLAVGGTIGVSSIAVAGYDGDSKDKVKQEFLALYEYKIHKDKTNEHLQGLRAKCPVEVATHFNEAEHFVPVSEVYNLEFERTSASELRNMSILNNSLKIGATMLVKGISSGIAMPGVALASAGVRYGVNKGAQQSITQLQAALENDIHIMRQSTPYYRDIPELHNLITQEKKRLHIVQQLNGDPELNSQNFSQKLEDVNLSFVDSIPAQSGNEVSRWRHLANSLNPLNYPDPRRELINLQQQVRQIRDGKPTMETVEFKPEEQGLVDVIRSSDWNSKEACAAAQKINQETPDLIGRVAKCNIVGAGAILDALGDQPLSYTAIACIVPIITDVMLQNTDQYSEHPAARTLNDDAISSAKALLLETVQNSIQAIEQTDKKNTMLKAFQDKLSDAQKAIKGQGIPALEQDMIQNVRKEIDDLVGVKGTSPIRNIMRKLSSVTSPPAPASSRSSIAGLPDLSEDSESLGGNSTSPTTTHADSAFSPHSSSMSPVVSNSAALSSITSSGNLTSFSSPRSLAEGNGSISVSSPTSRPSSVSLSDLGQNLGVDATNHSVAVSLPASSKNKASLHRTQSITVGGRK